MLIQVDVDNTLYDSDEAFRLAAIEFGIAWPDRYDPQYACWFKAEDIGTDLTTLLDVFKLAHSRAADSINVPFEGAAEVLGQIADEYEEVEIAYVSDRNEALGEPLRQWLSENGFLHNEAQHIVVSKDKRGWMKENRPDIVIDDRVRTILFSRYEIGAKVISLIYPYNINLKNEADGIYMLPDWKSIGITLNEVVLPELKVDRKELATA